MDLDASVWSVTRRELFKASGLVAVGVPLDVDAADGVSVRFGVVTDAHYAETPSRGIRYYGESAEKMAECVELMNEQGVDFLVELGDFKDEGVPSREEETLAYLERIESVFSRFNGRRYHVLGNHDVDSISKEQFLSRVHNSGIAGDASYYSFDAGGLHFVVLDANFRGDGVAYSRGNFDWRDTHVPEHELAWLAGDLASTSCPVIVFVHQRLDGSDDLSVRNAAAVRGVLQDSQRVQAVFQGHHHAGGYRLLEGIHYYTLKAMVDGSGLENSAYAVVEVMSDRSLVVTGYRKVEGRTVLRA
jgi:predicted phosphodiesterase